jgi:starvation-inducible DNA-binding protein
MEELYKLSKKAFATHYHYLLKSQNFHWNVTGPDFLEFHELFEEIYEDLEDSLDTFAEGIRGIQCMMPAGFIELNELSDIYDAVLPLTAMEMVGCLYRDNGKLVKILLEAYKQAELDNEHGFSSFLAERLAQHRKHGWKLYSYL